jgi:hypothetical protein
MVAIVDEVSRMFRFFLIVIAVVGGWLGYQRYQSRNTIAPVAPAALEERVIQPPSWHGHAPGSRDNTTSQSGTPQVPSFVCDGRTHCSQMRSCEEATFFLRNCPNTKMDGNNDGVPCESQWCRK